MGMRENSQREYWVRKQREADAAHRANVAEKKRRDEERRLRAQREAIAAAEMNASQRAKLSRKGIF